MGKKNKSIWLKGLINNSISPFILLVAKIFYHTNIWEIKENYLIIIEKHKQIKSNSVPLLLINMLILAEDRKYMNHMGIDVVAIIRAIISNWRGHLQGASTITQQYIRVLSSCYEFTIKRKLKEIFLSLLLFHKLNKEDVLKNYLTVAYFGYGMVGWKNAVSSLNFSQNSLTSYQAATLIARLKYPDRKEKDIRLEQVRRSRAIYLNNTYKKHVYWQRKGTSKLYFISYNAC